jgi:hypothetical protein
MSKGNIFMISLMRYVKDYGNTNVPRDIVFSFVFIVSDTSLVSSNFSSLLYTQSLDPTDNISSI